MESKMTEVEKQTLSTKLENSFLGILRVVILIVLTVSLVGSAIYAYMGLSSMNATPQKYEYKDPNIKEMVEELKKSLEDKPAAPATPVPKQDEPQKKDDKLGKEIDKQYEIVATFLKQYSKNLRDPDAWKQSARARATNLAFEPENESSVMRYAEGQTELFNKIFTDKDVIAKVGKNVDGILPSFFETALRVYPDYFRRQKDAQKKFEREQEQKVMMKQAGAAMNLYIAAGMFATFLIISLILVLVKIERNLRVRPI
jgi:flagellar basal body-associated protein FliL